jgi:hypothetical protein
LRRDLGRKQVIDEILGECTSGLPASEEERQAGCETVWLSATVYNGSFIHNHSIIQSVTVVLLHLKSWKIVHKILQGVSMGFKERFKSKELLLIVQW